MCVSLCEYMCVYVCTFVCVSKCESLPTIIYSTNNLMKLCNINIFVGMTPRDVREYHYDVMIYSFAMTLDQILCLNIAS